jgi:hypothetical protein
MKSYSTLSLVFLAGFLFVAISGKILLNNNCSSIISRLIKNHFLVFPGNKTTGNEDTPQLLSSTIDVSNASETRPASAPVAATASEEDKKLLLPLLAMKPLVIAGGLLAGGKLNQKKPSMPSPAVAAPRPTAVNNNNVLVVIDDNIQQQQLVLEKSEGDDDEPRKLLIPMMAMKPLLLVSVLTGAKLVKLPAISPPKIGITITKHEYPKQFADGDTMP